MVEYDIDSIEVTFLFSEEAQDMDPYTGLAGTGLKTAFYSLVNVPEIQGASAGGKDVKFKDEDGNPRLGDAFEWELMLFGAYLIGDIPPTIGEIIDTEQIMDLDCRTTSDIEFPMEITFFFEEANKYTVIFVDHDGTELSTAEVEHGSDATAPADPEREGHAFTGWDVAFNNVTSDLTVTAEYTINAYTVNFNVIPKDAIVAVKDSQGVEVIAEVDGTYELEAGDYTYTVSAEGYDDERGNFTVTDTGKTITVECKLSAVPIVEQKINDLPCVEELTLNDKEAVIAARNAYAGLTEDQKNLVTNIDDLIAAEVKIVELEADKAATEEANSFKTSHATALELTVDDVTIDNKDIVNEALSAYEDLSEAAQAKLTDEKALLDELLAKIGALEDDKVAAEIVIGLINEIPEIDKLTLDDKIAIEEARTVYDDLTEEQKVLVGNKDKLIAAEANITALEIAVEELATAKATRKADIETIVSASNYTKEENKAAYEAKVAEVKEAIDALDTVEAVENYDIKAQFADIETDADIAAAQKLAEATAAVETAEESKDQADVDAAQATVDVLGEDVTEKADLQTRINAVQAEIDSIKALETAKTDAKLALGTYVNADDYTTNADVLSDAIVAGKSAIDEAETKEAVASALANAESAIDEIKSDAEIAAEELATAKTNAKGELEGEFERYAKGNYEAADWTILAGFKTDGEAAIEAAADLAAVTLAKTTAIDGMAGVYQKQVAPEGLTGVAPTSLSDVDGKITGTTTAMEYKLASAEDSAYVACLEDVTTDLAAGTYNVRYAAKEGFNAGTAAEVVVDEYVANTDASVLEVKVKDTVATVDESDDKVYNVELAAGIVLADLTATDIVVITTDTKTSVATAITSDGGATWTVVVTTEDGTIETYTINVTVASNADQEAAQVVIDAIQDLPEVDDLNIDENLDDLEAVEGAEEAYKKLSPDAKALVESYTIAKLNSVIEKITELVLAGVDDRIDQAVGGLINLESAGIQAVIYENRTATFLINDPEILAYLFATTGVIDMFQEMLADVVAMRLNDGVLLPIENPLEAAIQIVAVLFDVDIEDESINSSELIKELMQIKLGKLDGKSINIDLTIQPIGRKYIGTYLVKFESLEQPDTNGEANQGSDAQMIQLSTEDLSVDELSEFEMEVVTEEVTQSDGLAAEEAVKNEANEEETSHKQAQE